MEELKVCPFCGGIPMLIMIGNNHTKSKKVTIKCEKCRVERTNAAIYNDFDWLKELSIKHWNMRFTEQVGDDK